MCICNFSHAELSKTTEKIEREYRKDILQDSKRKNAPFCKEELEKICSKAGLRLGIAKEADDKNSYTVEVAPLNA